MTKYKDFLKNVVIKNDINSLKKYDKLTKRLSQKDKKFKKYLLTNNQNIFIKYGGMLNKNKILSNLDHIIDYYNTNMQILIGLYKSLPGEENDIIIYISQYFERLKKVKGDTVKFFTRYPKLDNADKEHYIAYYLTGNILYYLDNLQSNLYRKIERLNVSSEYQKLKYDSMAKTMDFLFKFKQKIIEYGSLISKYKSPTSGPSVESKQNAPINRAIQNAPINSPIQKLKSEYEPLENLMMNYGKRIMELFGKAIRQTKLLNKKNKSNVNRRAGLYFHEIRATVQMLDAKLKLYKELLYSSQPDINEIKSQFGSILVYYRTEYKKAMKTYIDKAATIAQSFGKTPGEMWKTQLMYDINLINNELGTQLSKFNDLISESYNSLIIMSELVECTNLCKKKLGITNDNNTNL